ncbi:MAG: hypothetical protein R2698_10935 [Microthrixaceae bacterium]
MARLRRLPSPGQLSLYLYLYLGFRFELECGVAGVGWQQPSRAMSLDLRHRVPRFFESLRPGPIRRGDREWAGEVLEVSERLLFDVMSDADQRHAVRVARRVEEVLDDRDDPGGPVGEWTAGWCCGRRYCTTSARPRLASAPMGGSSRR